MEPGCVDCVVPLVGTWIEIPDYPSSAEWTAVVPLVGTWIEIGYSLPPAVWKPVVPLVGTWIEIFLQIQYMIRSLSFPSWERGLKYPAASRNNRQLCRSPRGNVD